MGQVPKMHLHAHQRANSDSSGILKSCKLPFLLVGRGRLAQHLSQYFQLEGITFKQWGRAELGEYVSRVQTLNEPHRILLAVSDQAIEKVGHLKWPTDSVIVHFSGSLSVPNFVGVHPLMAFGPAPLSLQEYRSIPFIGEGGNLQFEQVFPELSNPSFQIPPSNRNLYHALCVVAGNLSIRLWQRVADEFKSHLGLPPEILEPYRQQTFQNMNIDLAKALTGPMVRGDWNTVEKNIDSLADSTLQDIYLAFLRDYLSFPPPNAKLPGSQKPQTNVSSMLENSK